MAAVPDIPHENGEKYVYKQALRPFSCSPELLEILYNYISTPVQKQTQIKCRKILNLLKITLKRYVIFPYLAEILLTLLFVFFIIKP